jgi:hypothetical protein
MENGKEIDHKEYEAQGGGGDNTRSKIPLIRLRGRELNLSGSG